MKWIDAETIRRVSDYVGMAEAIDTGHRDGVDVTDRVVITQPSPTVDGNQNAFLCLPSWQRGKALGAKVCTLFPENAESGGATPAVQAVYLLFDGVDGSPLCAIDATELTYWKTASDSALGARYLARSDARTLVMLGAGGLGPHVIAAHRAVRPSIDRVLIWNRTFAKAQALADQIGGEAVEDRDAAVAEADIVSAATNATEPLIAGRLLKPGCHVDLIGSYTPEMREADDDTMRRGVVYCDDKIVAARETGDLLSAIAAGALSEDGIAGDLTDLANGRLPGRTDAETITVYKNIGGGHIDLMTARYVWARAEP